MLKLLIYLRVRVVMNIGKTSPEKITPKKRKKSPVKNHPGKNHPGKNHPSKNHPVITLYNSLSVVCLSQADTICEGKWS